MDRIETGTTNERKVRTLIFVLMLTAFGLYFLYDGFKGYPAKNLEFLRQKLPAAPTKPLATNPKITKASLEELKARAQADLKPIPRAELLELLGEPAYEDAAKQELYFIGPAVFCRIQLRDGSLKLDYPEQWERTVFAEESDKYRESDIEGQKLWAKIVLIAAVIGLIQLIRIVRTKVVVDDEGLLYNGRRIAWDAMTALDISKYRQKGWVDLEYRDGEETEVLRIDNYKVNAFRDVVSALCARKAFPSPFAEAADSPKA